MSVQICPHCQLEITGPAERCPQCGSTLPRIIGRPQDDDVDAYLAAPSSRTSSGVEGGFTANSAYLAQETPYSPERLNLITDQVMQVTIRLLIVCGVILIAIAVYVSRSAPPPPPLPAGIATMITSVPPPASPAVSQTGGTAAPIPSSAVSSTNTDDVGNYLSFLQKIDLQRVGLINTFDQALTADQVGSATTMLESSQSLLRDFLVQKPPPVCSDLSSAYYRMLQDQTSMIAKACGSLQSSDLHDALAARDAAMPQIVADAQTADQSLTQLCGVEHLDKPFTLQADPAVSNNTAPAAPAAALPPPSGSQTTVPEPQGSMPSTAPPQ